MGPAFPGTPLRAKSTSRGVGMARAVVLFVAAMAAAVLAGACGAAPQRVEVGEIKTQSRSVEVEGADSAKVNLRLALGELDVGGGAAENRLMEADRAEGRV